MATSHEPPGWQRFTRSGFGLEFSYPAVTPQGDLVDRDDEPFRSHDRVHVSSPDKRELYFEVVRFHDLVPHHEYLEHRPYLEERFGPDAITELTETSLQGRPACAYAFHGDAIERAALLLQVDRDTYRVIYDPRSPLNTQVLETITIAD